MVLLVSQFGCHAHRVADLVTHFSPPTCCAALTHTRTPATPPFPSAACFPAHCGPIATLPALLGHGLYWIPTACLYSCTYFCLAAKPRTFCPSYCDWMDSLLRAIAMPPSGPVLACHSIPVCSTHNAHTTLSCLFTFLARTHLRPAAAPATPLPLPLHTTPHCRARCLLHLPTCACIPAAHTCPASCHSCRHVLYHPAFCLPLPVSRRYILPTHTLHHFYHTYLAFAITTHAALRLPTTTR